MSAIRFETLSATSPLSALRAFIDQEQLPVSKQVGGIYARTLQDIYEDIEDEWKKRQVNRPNMPKNLPRTTGIWKRGVRNHTTSIFVLFVVLSVCKIGLTELPGITAFSSLDDMKAFNTKYNLHVPMNVGGLAKRTKEQIYKDLKRVCAICVQAFFGAATPWCYLHKRLGHNDKLRVTVTKILPATFMRTNNCQFVQVQSSNQKVSPDFHKFGFVVC